MIVTNIGPFVFQRSIHADIRRKLRIATGLGVAVHLRVAGMGHGWGVMGNATGNVEPQLGAIVYQGVAIFKTNDERLFVVRGRLKLLGRQTSQKCAVIEDATGREQHALLTNARRTPVDVCARVGAEPAYPIGEVIARTHAHQYASGVYLFDGGVLDEFFDGLFGIERHVASVMHAAQTGNTRVFVRGRGQTPLLRF